MHAQVAEHRPQLRVQPLLRHVVRRRVARVSLPSRSTVTRFSGRGRSSVESQNRSRARRRRSSDHCGASRVSPGFSPRNIGACDFPTIWMFPSGRSNSSLGSRSRSARASSGRSSGSPPGRARARPGCCGTCSFGRPGRIRWQGRPGAVVRRREQQLGGVGRAAGEHDHVAGDRLGCAVALTTTPVTAVAGALRLEPHGRRVVSSVTFWCSSAGRTPSTSASDLPWTAHGKPSQFWQRTHALYGMFALVQPDAARRVERVVAGCSPVVRELLDARLVRHRRERIRRARTAARSDPRRARRAPGTAARPACSTAPSRRRRSAMRATARRDAAARRSPPPAAGTARRRRASSRHRRSSGPAAGTASRPRRTRCRRVCSGRRRTRPARASSAARAGASRRARAAGSACRTGPGDGERPPPAPLPITTSSVSTLIPPPTVRASARSRRPAPVGGLGPPRPPCAYGCTGGGFVEQRLHHPPALLDAVLAA